MRGELRCLSRRELEVVRCVAEGLSNREIAQRLGLTEHTVKNYLFRIFDKLGVSKRVEVVLYAYSLGNVAEIERPRAGAHGKKLAPMGGPSPTLSQISFTCGSRVWRRRSREAASRFLLYRGISWLFAIRFLRWRSLELSAGCERRSVSELFPKKPICADGVLADAELLCEEPLAAMTPL